jgi:hypothetical protein
MRRHGAGSMTEIYYVKIEHVDITPRALELVQHSFPSYSSRVQESASLTNEQSRYYSTYSPCIVLYPYHRHVSLQGPAVGQLLLLQIPSRHA